MLAAAWERFLARTRLDLLTAKERTLVLGLIAALLWGVIGNAWEKAHYPRYPSGDPAGLYDELLAALPPDEVVPPSPAASPPTIPAGRPVAPRAKVPPPLSPGARSPGGKAPAPSRFSWQSPGDKININRASLEELQELPGIGPALAGRIVEYRERHGSFGSIEALKKVQGIGDKRLEQIRDRVRLY
jgi:competence ComEA-like helix-hairpin-helix protein